ncbi:MAG: phosphoadenosine phosphosulfate reductase family protein [Novosphingobium sp.]|nr:phosphoadenosine phosphosulfate reductase family protein [Novosphingobium sp.]
MIALDLTVRRALSEGADVAFNLSGGKDSGAAALAVSHFLDGIGHPRDRRVAIHADLGRAEWRETMAMAERQAAFIGVPLVVVRRKAGDMVHRWEQRFANGLARYVDLLTYNLIGPWSSASLRFCTSELKAQVIGPHLSRELRGRHIVQVVGIRREESVNRRHSPISKPDHRYAKPGNRWGTQMTMFHPLVDWTTQEVFSFHTRHGLPLHPAYSWGCSRVSCAFCIMQSIADAKAAATVAGNVPLYLHLVEMEAISTFSFWPDRWLADVAPLLLSPALAALVVQGKTKAAERQAIEAAMPAGLRYVKGWPVRVPTNDEAEAIVTARRTILSHHGQPEHYPTATSVIARFALLMAEHKARSARRGS